MNGILGWRVYLATDSRKERIGTLVSEPVFSPATHDWRCLVFFDRSDRIESHFVHHLRVVTIQNGEKA